MELKLALMPPSLGLYLKTITGNDIVTFQWLPLLYCSSDRLQGLGQNVGMYRCIIVTAFGKKIPTAEYLTRLDLVAPKQLLVKQNVVQDRILKVVQPQVDQIAIGRLDALVLTGKKRRDTDLTRNLCVFSSGNKCFFISYFLLQLAQRQILIMKGIPLAL